MKRKKNDFFLKLQFRNVLLLAFFTCLNYLIILIGQEQFSLRHVRTNQMWRRPISLPYNISVSPTTIAIGWLYKRTIVRLARPSAFHIQSNNLDRDPLLTFFCSVKV